MILKFHHVYITMKNKYSIHVANYIAKELENPRLLDLARKRFILLIQTIAN